jgi:UDP-N-acetylmuramate--alanine ligase
VDIENIHKVYFLGIGGIGMSALAWYFHSRGAAVSGYDRTPSAVTERMAAAGINMHFTEDITLIPEGIDLVVFTPALPTDHKEYVYFLEHGYPVKKRSEVLGLISGKYQTLAVAGTHGKTSVSTLLAHILHTARLHMMAFLGGISKNYDTNFISSRPADYLVAEADEFDRSFLQLHPYIGIITSADADHLDVYGSKEILLESFGLFARQVREGGKLIIKHGLPFNAGEKVRKYSYSLHAGADFHTAGLTHTGDHYRFDLHFPGGTWQKLVLGTPALFNVENSVAALAAAILCGAREESIREALISFKGVKRRFDILIDSSDLIYIDDYAHHPEEINALIRSVRHRYPGRKITGVFQPHLYSRTRDFALEFARSLDQLDEVLLMDIYPAREKPIEGVGWETIFRKMKNSHKAFCTGDTLVEELKRRKLQVLLTIGAGDIDLMAERIRTAFSKTDDPTVK